MTWTSKTPGKPGAIRNEQLEREAMEFLTRRFIAVDGDVACDVKAKCMTWTSKRPTKPGWYWWRKDKSDDDPCFARVFNSFFDQRLYVGFGDTWKSSHCPLLRHLGQWAGPLEPPTEEI